MEKLVLLGCLNRVLLMFQFLPRYALWLTPPASIADCVLTLPLYAGLSTEDVDRICDIILG